jgi:hypothetical protein
MDFKVDDRANVSRDVDGEKQGRQSTVDAYFSADVETDGPVPGPFSILSFGWSMAAHSEENALNGLQTTHAASTGN